MKETLMAFAAVLLITGCASQAYNATYQQARANCPQTPYTAFIECEIKASRLGLAAAGSRADSSMELMYAKMTEVAEAVDRGQITSAQGNAAIWEISNAWEQQKRHHNQQAWANAANNINNMNAQMRANTAAMMQMPLYSAPSVPSYGSNGFNTTTYVTGSGLKYTHCRDNVCLAR